MKNASQTNDLERKIDNLSYAINRVSHDLIENGENFDNIKIRRLLRKMNTYYIEILQSIMNSKDNITYDLMIRSSRKIDIFRRNLKVLNKWDKPDDSHLNKENKEQELSSL